MGHIELWLTRPETGEKRCITYDVKPEDSCWVLGCPEPVRGYIEVIRGKHVELACVEHRTRGHFVDGP